ncbi:hypothetical protein [Mycolicibacterium komossense]|uniref:Uncharacterized protein n=1 Tax=Mycolicibacterium komossense TaxID=1779 RepID=A0ABT3C9I6_9MYCO|nr:hypothetical protein [Mycolicibacterium komossense]MCV7226076.1 hypothetical protein [Mycolicibacterium komossense]
MTGYKAGDALTWTAAPACGGHSHDHQRVSFRRYVGTGYAEVMTCRGSRTVPITELYPTPETNDENPHDAYYAAKARVIEALTAHGATSLETAVQGFTLGDELDEAAYMVAARGAEVKYRPGVGYWIGRTRNNGRAT